MFEDDDPRVWRKECANTGGTTRLGELLDKWKEEYAQLNWITVPVDSPGDTWHTYDRNDKEYNV